MAAECGEAPKFGLNSETAAELGVKIEMLDPGESEPGKDTGKLPHVPQPGSLREFWEGTAPEHVKREPKVGLEECWEAQWQQFLKAVQLPPSERENPALRRFGLRELCEVDSSPPEGTSDTSPWPRGQGTAPLLSGLSRGVQEACRSPLAKEEASSRTVKEEGPEAECVRQRFRQFRYQEAEGPREVCSRLRALCRRWLQPEKRSKEQMVELLVLEQFLAVLPPQMQSRVTEGSPESCGQAVALAEEFLLQQQREEDGREEQVMEAFTAGAASSVEAGKAPPDTWQTMLFREVKQEQNRDATYEGSGRCGEEKTSQPENSGELQPYWMVSESTEPNVPRCSELGGVSGGRKGSSSPDRAEDAPVRCQQGYVPLDGRLTQPRIAKSGREKTCAECGKTFRWRAELVAHERAHTGEKPYECLDCGRSFSYKSRLIAHKKMHTGEKPYKCADCGKSFSRQPHLIAHERVHTGEKPYACSECGRSFSDRSNLNTHKRTHTGEKPYRCAHCGKSFSQSSTCMKHERIHTGEKPYKCAVCSKSFCQRSQLINHERIHTGEKPYKCAVCGKEFSRRTDLVTHQRRHTGEKPYKCVECGRSFSAGSSLNEHKRSHTGEKAHRCSRCGRRFAHLSDCVKHERNHAQE